MTYAVKSIPIDEVYAVKSIPIESAVNPYGCKAEGTFRENSSLILILRD
jgi:hypothetical protein